MRLLAAGLAALVLLQSPGGDLVELDVVVLDRGGSPVTGLRRDEFQVREDGRAVDLKTFAEISDTGAGDGGGRQIVLLLDDTLPAGGTPVVQTLARAVLSQKRERDEVTVVRLNNDRDEPFGDTETALDRIARYRAAAVPYQMRGSGERSLRVVASIARSLEAVEHRRKLIVCVGGPGVCNVLEPQPRGYSLLWRPWVEAMGATARANASVYAMMPTAPGAVRILAGGLAEFTGGDGFMNTSRIEAFINAIWREASQYYLLGYWPEPQKRELHDVDVRTTRKDLRVRARRTRA
jgi:VWFA-related protein